jgi:hypothetical protein
LTAILRSEAGRVAAGGLAGAHAKYGPAGLVKGGGHAFDRGSRGRAMSAGLPACTSTPGHRASSWRRPFRPESRSAGNVGGLAGIT